MGREIVKETTLATLLMTLVQEIIEKILHYDGFKTSEEVTLWDDHDHETGHFWNMSIDLTLCQVVAVISCHAENNARGCKESEKET